MQALYLLLEWKRIVMKKIINSHRNLLKILWIVYAVASIVIWVPQVDRLLTKDYDSISECVSLDDAWEIKINDDMFHNVSLDTFQFPAAGGGDSIVMERKIPGDWKFTEAVLRLYARQSAVRIWVDDALIYEYGADRAKAHKTVGSGFMFIDFPEEYGGKNLKIELKPAEDKVFTKFDSLRLYPWKNAYRVVMTENRLPLFFGGFLFIFGLAVCIMTIFAIVFSRKYVRLLCISVFSLCMGLWTVCYYPVLVIFAIPLYSISLMEHIAFYMAPFPLLLYLHRDVVNLENKVLRRLYTVLLVSYLIVFGVAMGLHTFDIVHLAAMIQYMMVFLILCLIFSFIVVVMSFKGSKAQNRIYLLGVLLVVFCIGYDLTGYISDRYLGNSSLLAVKGVSSIGVMGFIFLLFLSFYIEMTRNMMQEAERSYLIKSAYTDELTRLYNRRYCMKYMKEIREEKTFDYTIFCFDLNNLKMVNDTFGHGKGDILIKCAGDVLTETFGDCGVVARMGGDEFIAVVHTADRKKIEELKELFLLNISKKNRKIKDLHMSIAWGFALGNETGQDIEKVYQMADDRMYEKKKEMKKVSGK